MWRRLLLLGAALTAISCSKDAVRVEFYTVDGYTFSDADKQTIRSIANDTALEVRRLLPGLPELLCLKVRPGADVIPETGESASAFPPDTIYWTVDPKRATETIRAQLRPTLFHELHHLVRDAKVPRDTILDAAISEGMATVFERDYAGAAAPWGQYPPEVSAWAQELRALPPSAPRQEWLFRHPDGRRWIGFKVGTYLVERARSSLGQPLPALIYASSEAVARAGTSTIAGPP